ncbi:MAG TPA: hypothetical protein VFG87_02435 [Amycolatopsis sp.]|nr:hypothetical protein [Amycolatopsis sp.]
MTLTASCVLACAGLLLIVAMLGSQTRSPLSPLPEPLAPLPPSVPPPTPPMNLAQDAKPVVTAGTEPAVTVAPRFAAASGTASGNASGSTFADAPTGTSVPLTTAPPSRSDPASGHAHPSTRPSQAH